LFYALLCCEFSEIVRQFTIFFGARLSLSIFGEYSVPNNLSIEAKQKNRRPYYPWSHGMFSFVFSGQTFDNQSDRV
jgi:hypothetical protein